MAKSHRAAAIVSLHVRDFAKQLGDLLSKWNFTVHHVEELVLAARRRGVLVFGTSGPLRGAGILAFVFQGARYVPFIVRAIEKGPEETEVVVAAAGAEYLIPTDWGRNQNIVELILAQFPGNPIEPPPLSGTKDEESDVMEWREAAPGL